MQTEPKPFDRYYIQCNEGNNYLFADVTDWGGVGAEMGSRLVRLRGEKEPVRLRDTAYVREWGEGWSGWSGFG